jgi:predicted CoA-binding protein
MPLEPDALRQLLEQSRTIAIVGLSPDPQRASHGVARYLQAHGYRIVPVNPRCTEILGERCYAGLEDIPFAVDLVDVFRRTEELVPIARSAVAIGARGLWQQLGVVSVEAHAIATAAGLVSVMDRCIKIDHQLVLPAT